jgi:IS4 transposase
MLNILRLKKEHLISKKSKLEESDHPMEEILNSEGITEQFNNAHSFRDRIYTPIKSLMMMISQCMSKERKSCAQVVSEVVAKEAEYGKEVASSTGGYVQARNKLSVDSMKGVMQKIDKTAQEINDHANRQWHGFDIKMVDGTTLQLADTVANQASFPQHGNQKEGCGFPLARMVVLMSLSTGTVIDYAMAAHKGKMTGEHALFRSISHHIDSNTILLADAYYPSYFMISELLNKSAHGVFKASNTRNNESEVIDKNGKNDLIVLWHKPSKPDWMNEDEYRKHPRTLTLRLIKINGIAYITTLTDKKYHRKEIGKLYSERWKIELNLRSLKTFMGMEMLVCKSPKMIKKEITAYFIAYNLIRVLMVKSGVMFESEANELSFTHAMANMQAFSIHIMLSQNAYQLWLSMFKAISEKRVANRKGRSEPRVVKRRAKPFPKMNQKRSDYKKCTA